MCSCGYVKCPVDLIQQQYQQVIKSIIITGTRRSFNDTTVSTVLGERLADIASIELLQRPRSTGSPTQTTPRDRQEVDRLIAYLEDGYSFFNIGNEEHIVLNPSIIPSEMQQEFRETLPILSVCNVNMCVGQSELLTEQRHFFSKLK